MEPSMRKLPTFFDRFFVVRLRSGSCEYDDDGCWQRRPYNGFMLSVHSVPRA
jgi:hypothetical protein